jgi:lipid-binding SYLF domain-containing protein
MLEARALMQRAAAVGCRMEATPKLRLLVNQSRAILIVPGNAIEALPTGSSARTGVLLAHRRGRWSDPTFYDISGLTIGGQRYGTTGPVVLMLMSDKAASSFNGANVFSLNAGAGFTLVDSAARNQGSVGGAADVIVWSEAKGISDDPEIDVSEIAFDEDETSAYYGRKMPSARDVFTGNIARPPEDPLGHILG